jgi:hypothetical protein
MQPPAKTWALQRRLHKVAYSGVLHKDDATSTHQQDEFCDRKPNAMRAKHDESYTAALSDTKRSLAIGAITVGSAFKPFVRIAFRDRLGVP